MAGKSSSPKSPSKTIQDITTSTLNSTEANLANGATFTGTADETLGISGIQIYHAADQWKKK